ncbi:Tat (twin-arginine translocation) pathway signal sequence [Haloplanus vescus]|uniref:Tat (Twin-arginine translocation) pathway signal sequence n=1 Tax=Haloplanus vescus TaxID=555874 RepID=A0A1H3VNP6_9EURY|nr:twin-arginine translocation signal domain-containing protein [Haloplanus vescus]SDZ76390.1 Tat (twin-arginine translocation) pathway signal sequence [Haloplanus vescus]
MFDDTSRRSFLQFAGVGAAASMAGCSSLGNHEGGNAEPATVTLGIQPSQESLQELQSDIQSQVQSGELSRMEAQQRFSQRRMELTREAVGSFRNRTGNVSVSVNDAVEDVGALRVSGDPAALIETLSFEEVSGMFPASVFDQAQSQSGTGTQSSATQTPTE